MNESDFWKEFGWMNYDFSLATTDIINFKLFDSRWKWLLEQIDYQLFITVESKGEP